MGGKGGSQTIGYWYYLTMHMGLTAGPVDEISEIRGDNKTMYPLLPSVALVKHGNVYSPVRGAMPPPITTSGSVKIDAPNLYGGERQEGGVVGTLTVLMGESTQQPNAALAAIEPTYRPAYIGVCTAVFKGAVAALNPYVKAWSFRVRRHLQGWTTPVWHPELIRVGRGMNPVHIVYQRFTDQLWGGGEDASTALDEAAMLRAAQALYSEGFGLCLKWSMQDSIGSFVDLVLDHIGAMPYVDPVTNKFGIRLLRGDYDPVALASNPVNLIDENDIIEMSSYQQPVLNETVNEVTVTYLDVVTNTPAAVTYQNLANVQAQGKVVSDSVKYAGLWNGDLAARAAARECHSKSALLIKGETKIKSSRWKDVKVGDVKLLTYRREQCVLMPIRILSVNYGDATSRSITMHWAQDGFSVPLGTYVKPVETQWAVPNTQPQPIINQRLFEASYRDLARTLDAPYLAGLATTSCYVSSIAGRPAGTATPGYQLCMRQSSGDYEQRGNSDYCASGALVAAMGPGDRTLTITGFDDLTMIAPGTAAKIENEDVRVDAIDPVTGALTIGRGCADTVPAAHPIGARVWFYEDSVGSDRTEHVTGETVTAKLLTTTTMGMLDPAQATAVTAVMIGRQARPYPPGLLKIRSSSYPSSTIEGALTLTWAHRSRVLQADQLIDTTSASIGPETGVTYTVRVYLDGKLDSTTTGITATALTPAVSGDGVVSVEISAMRDGLSSWQSLSATFNYLRGDQRLTEDGDARTTEDDILRITES